MPRGWNTCVEFLLGFDYHRQRIVETRRGECWQRGTNETFIDSDKQEGRSVATALWWQVMRISWSKKKIRSRFFWVKLKDVVHDCYWRYSTSNRPQLRLRALWRRFERIATYIAGPLYETDRRNKNFLVVTDYFSKWFEAYALRSLFHKYTMICKIFDVKIRTLLLHPQLDGNVERMNRTINRNLAKVVSYQQRDI